jgi:glutamate racemase
MQPIGVFDSGVGGLTVLKAITERLPEEALCYFADTAHVPYGPQPPANIIRYSLEIADFLIGQGAKLIVVACNTATAAALHVLRAEWPLLSFVGMEPAVKPAAQATRSGKVGVLATFTTINSDRYASLMRRFAHRVQVWEDPCIGLVPLIEQGLWDDPETKHLLAKILLPMMERGIDTIVLGCTHYPLVEPLIRQIVGPNMAIINPAPAVARRVEELLLANDMRQSGTNATPPYTFFASGTKSVMELTINRLLDKEYPVTQVILPLHPDADSNSIYR